MRLRAGGRWAARVQKQWGPIPHVLEYLAWTTGIAGRCYVLRRGGQSSRAAPQMLALERAYTSQLFQHESRGRSEAPSS